jgi:NADH:ubiquinone oxidoreductase subunit E
MMISIQTSVDDLQSTFRCSIEQYTEKDFEEAIAKETARQNRTTVIKLLKRALRMKQQGARHI